jgi:hypothetical protein
VGHIEFNKMADLNIICLEDIISGLIEQSRESIDFDEFVEIILSQDLLEYCLILLAFLKLVALFDHERQKALFKKMFSLAKQQKETRFKRKLGHALIWSWNNVELISKYLVGSG